jgi:hypothetical protein
LAVSVPRINGAGRSPQAATLIYIVRHHRAKRQAFFALQIGAFFAVFVLQIGAPRRAGVGATPYFGRGAHFA